LIDELMRLYVGRWITEGMSLFAEQWKAVEAKLATPPNTS
jgi:hypothetical protein